ncbi:HAD family phosphatase [Aliikangiella sp. G2MR2-5]|uniref:HAD family hydrolase n=1 Tax=Aliikangiella sp. G2MR2-5 TaxID=2788943 RepID=UPI0018A88787|nr:HAD family phosphatase [Aliikangiella sp. G2MR2-5]
MRLRCVIFDLDGVIIESSQLHTTSFQRAFEMHGYSFSREAITKFVSKGLSREAVIRSLITEEDNELLESIAKNKGIVLKQLLRNSSQNKIEQLVHTHSGARELLSYIHQNNIKIALASSSMMACDIVKRLGLFQYFSYISFPSSEIKAKPDPDVYLEVLKRLELNRSECIAIEDSTTGIKSALSAGIETYVFNSDKKARNKIARHLLMFQELDEIKNQIESLIIP